MIGCTDAALGKGAAGAGFQIPLEMNSFFLSGELDDDNRRPRAMVDGITAGSVIVPLESIFDVFRDVPT